jgi:lysozyme family protein
MTAFDRAFGVVIGHEGDLSDDARDPGGLTRYGISQRAHPGVDVRNLTLAQAKQIYLERYWLPLRADAMPEAVALQVFDAAVNHGIKPAVRMLQRALGVPVDGVIGPVTLNAMVSVDDARFVAHFAAERLSYYTDLAGWEVYGRGWTRRVASNLRQA